MGAGKVIAGTVGLVLMNIYLLSVMWTFWQARKSMLVRARSPHLAVIHGFTLLITADVFIVQEIVQSAGKHMPCAIGYWSVSALALASARACIHRAAAHKLTMHPVVPLIQCTLQVFILYGCVTLAYPLR